MKRKRTYIVGLVIILACILFFTYKVNLNNYKSPPSDRWSKEVIVGDGQVKNTPSIIKKDNKVIIGYDDGNKLRLTVTNEVGDIENEQSYEVDEDFIMSTSLCKVKDGYWFSYTSTKDSIGYMETLILDESFKKKDAKKTENVVNMQQIDGDLILICKNDKIIILNTETQSQIELKQSNISMISAVKLENEYLISYLQEGRSLKYTILKNNEFTKPKEVMQLTKMTNVTYSSIACSSDGTYGYTLVEERNKGAFSGTKVIKYDLKTGESELYKLKVNNSEEIYYNRGVYSTKGARFLATTPRLFGKRDIQENIIDYTMKNGEVIDFSYATRLRELCIYPNINEDVMTFISFKDEKSYNVNIASTNESFKKVNNEVRKTEYKDATTATIQDILNSVSYLFILGLRWILPTFVICGAISFFEYNISKDKKRKVFLGLCITATVFKCYGLLSVIYTNYKVLLPEVISSVYTATFICLIISFLSYGLGYVIYKKDEEMLTLLPISLALIIDSLLSVMVFVPYIV